MTDFTDVLRRHAAAYPAMEPADAVKLCYHAAMGGEHLAPEEGRSLALLTEEMAAAPDDAPLTEDCGGDVFRLHLGPARQLGLSPQLVNRLFLTSAAHVRGTQAALEEKLTVLEENAALFAFSPEALRAFLADYRRRGCPPLHHSDTYRRLYRPSYRLVAGRFVPLLPLLAAMERSLAEKGRAWVAIDGLCGSGKTTLGDQLAPLFDADLIHMDDFFLPPALRTPERRALGNVHYERFAQEVLEPLRAGGPFTYRRFSCRVGDFDGQGQVSGRPVVIVEGSYSCHPYFDRPWDVTVFLETDPAEQERRIRLRSGDGAWENFRTLWIPLEHAYFAKNQTRAQADFILQT